MTTSEWLALGIALAALLGLALLGLGALIANWMWKR